MTKTFTNRAGQTFTIEILADIGHAVEGRVVKGRKPFLGKVLVFAKHDMAEV
jgi:hypothetical protein